MQNTSVLIVGAGPSGLVAACLLAQRGVDVRVVDRAVQPAVTSRANILHARGVEVLDRVGALDGLHEIALAPVGMVMHAGTAPLATMRFAPGGRQSTQALFVSQAAIERRLRDRLADLGVSIEWGVEVTAAHQDTLGVTVTTADRNKFTVGWLLGCDGASSTVRTSAEIGFPGVPVVERFLLADVVVDWDQDRSTSCGWFTEEGVLLAIPQTDPFSGEATWRLMADVAQDGSWLDPTDIVSQLTTALRDRAGQRDVQVRRTVWTSVFRIQRRLATTYRSGRILIAGDAAHAHSPIGGQGMTTGMGDAENLAWKLSLVLAGDAAADLLDTYTAERRPLATDVLRTTTDNTRILVGTGRVSRLLRDRIFIPMLRSAVVQRAATRRASQLWVTYRGGPLARRVGPPGYGPRPGDRVPDAPVRTVAGDATRLHAALRSGWVVAAATPRAASAVADTIGSHLGPVASVVDARPGAEAWIIRPDGHLGWRGRPGRPSLQRFLSRFSTMTRVVRR